MAPVHAEATPIEINAPPERVREIMLDFEHLSEWHKGHFISISVPSGKMGTEVVAGDKLQVHLQMGMKFSPVIVENSSLRFRWRGSLPGVFTGDHVFEFHPSTTTPNGTTFKQYEDFTGMLSFTMKSEKKSGQQNLDGFNALNHDLKVKAEAPAA